MKLQTNRMDQQHPGWVKFGEYLYHAVYPSGRGSACRCDFQNTAKILQEHFPDVNIESTIEYFKSKGGWCDCETGFNICAGEDKGSTNN
jgi:hypothetical protein